LQANKNLKENPEGLSMTRLKTDFKKKRSKQIEVNERREEETDRKAKSNL